MVFASLVVEKLRLIMFLSQSVNSLLVLGLSAVIRCSSLLSQVKPLTKVWFHLALVSWPSCRQQTSLFMHGHGRAAFLFCYEFFFQLFQMLMLYFWTYKRPSILIPAPLALTEILRTCTLSAVALPSLQVSLQVSTSQSSSPSFSLIRATRLSVLI